MKATSRPRTVSLALTVVLTLVLALASSAAMAHATLVIGNLSVQPDPPIAGQSASVRVSLVDPLLVAVEDALVRIEFREIPPEDPQVPASITGTEAVEFLSLPVMFGTEYLAETEAGVYEGTFIAPAEGRYTVSVRDTTFRNEEAIANIGLNIGLSTTQASGANEPASQTANGNVAFVLPPTPMAPSSIGQWLLWIIGIPLAIGAIVTVLALRAKPDEAEGAQAPATDQTTQDG